MTALIHAAAKGEVEATRALVEQGADKEATAADGATALHAAAANGHVEAIKMLLQLGANKEARDLEGATPLHAAAANGHVEAMRALGVLLRDKEATPPPSMGEMLAFRWKERDSHPSKRFAHHLPPARRCFCHLYSAGRWPPCILPS